jgi:hypothetical protein
VIKTLKAALGKSAAFGNVFERGAPKIIAQSQPGDKAGESWRVHAAVLAHWARQRLVNRVDVRGGYRLSGVPVTRRGNVSLKVLERHFSAADASAIVGLHSSSADNEGRWCAIDIDAHGVDDLRTINEHAAQHWYEVLARRGFKPLLTGSNGRGGYHLRIVLAESIDAARLHHFASRLVADYATLGLSAPPEFFPKQPDIRKCAKQLGNWLRLPGKHHKRAYWSEVWSGSRWLADEDAIDYMLSLQGDEPALIPAVQKPSPKPVSCRRHCPRSDNLSHRAAAYMARLPNLSEGQGRDDVAFLFAAFLVRDLQIADNYALDWLERWDVGNNPPKGRERLAEIVRSAHAYGTRPYGCGRPPADAPRYDSRDRLILKATAEVY